MTCHQVQLSLSLYLYAELDFSQEEELERHLSECDLCKRALDREKAWHSALKAENADVPLEHQRLFCTASEASSNPLHQFGLCGLRLRPFS